MSDWTGARALVEAAFADRKRLEAQVEASRPAPLAPAGSTA